VEIGAHLWRLMHICGDRCKLVEIDAHLGR